LKDHVVDARAHALPIIGEGVIPDHRNRSVAQDEHTFLAIVQLFLRSWPFIRPQVMGRWLLPGEGIEEAVAEDIGSDDYHFYYAPVLLVVLALAGPYLGLMPAVDALGWEHYALYGLVGTIVLCFSYLAYTPGQLQLYTAGTLVFLVFMANFVATVVIDGYWDGLYMALLTVGCLVGWTVQLRRGSAPQELAKYRVRVGAHLVYYYGIEFIRSFVAVIIGLLLADMINMSILQNNPLTPTIANLIGIPQAAFGEELSKEIRYEIQFQYVVISLSLYFVQLPFNLFSPWYRMWILQRINQDLRLGLQERWLKLSLQYHSDHRVGDSIFRIYQDSSQVTGVIERLMEVSRTLFSYLVAVLFVSLLDPWLGLIASSIVIPGLLWAAWAMPRMRTASLVYREATSDLTSRVQETFSAIRLIKAYGKEKKTQRDFEEDGIVSFNSAYRVRRLVALVTIVMFTITSVFLLGAEFLISWWANQGKETFASGLIALIGLSFVVWNLTAFNWSKGELLATTNTIRGLMRQWLTAQDMAMGLQRVFDILDIEPDVVDSASAIPFEQLTQSIDFNNVHFSYEDTRSILDGVSFSAEPGSITAIVGPTGSGKTTLLSLLLRLFDPSEGNIEIDGIDLKAYQVDTLRKNIAIALQENVLFALSVKENIRYVSPDATDEQIKEAIRISCMAEYVDSLPEGIDTMLGDRGGRLSTGQRQRLSIARAVVRDTAILILDEPTAALDAATEHQVMKNLAEWGEGRAIFLITHRISTIRQAGKILYLEQGKIVESGDHETLMALDGGRYRSFVETESGLSNKTGGDNV
jgi:ABC-type multidrug transport system fused ATPase/permease subunit